MKQKPAQKYYAVKVGRQPGLYTDYNEVLIQTQRYSKSEYRVFMSYEEAMQYLNHQDNFVIQNTQAEIILQFDGGSRGNPGKAGSGAVVIDQQQRRWTGYKYLGEGYTNNEAEYEGLIIGLKYLLNQRMQTRKIEIQGDSKLVINHMLGLWTFNVKHLQKKQREAQDLMSHFTDVTLNWIPREKNSVADRLSNDAMDNEMSNTPYILSMQ